MAASHLRVAQLTPGGWAKPAGRAGRVGRNRPGRAGHPGQA